MTETKKRPGPQTQFNENVAPVCVTLDPETVEFYKEQSLSGHNLSEGIRVYWRKERWRIESSNSANPA